MSKRNSEDRASSCSFTFSDGRQCRMLRHSRDSQFCPHHDRQLSKLVSKFAKRFRISTCIKF